MQHREGVGGEHVLCRADAREARPDVVARVVGDERADGDALAPGSTISTIVVNHTSRFTRDATHARVVKKQLRRAGVRVLSVTQELTEDPMGTLMEGFTYDFFELIQ